MEIKLSPEERDLLVRLIDRAIGEMRSEVRRTSSPQMHDDIKRDAERLKELLDRLRALAS